MIGYEALPANEVARMVSLRLGQRSSEFETATTTKRPPAAASIRAAAVHRSPVASRYSGL